MYFYLTQSNGYKWNRVDQGPFSSKEELAEKVKAIAEAVEDFEGAAILANTDATASNKRINTGKSIRADWLVGQNRLTDSGDPEIRRIVTEALERGGYEVW